jgi:hypothetical protein
MTAKTDYSSDEFWAKQRKNEHADQTLRAETIGEKTLFIWSVQHEYNGCLNDDVEFSAWMWSNNIVKLGFGYLEVELKMALMTAYIPVAESDHYFAEESLNGVFKALKEKYAEGKLAAVSPLERWADDFRSYLKGNPGSRRIRRFPQEGPAALRGGGAGEPAEVLQGQGLGLRPFVRARRLSAHGGPPGRVPDGRGGAELLMEPMISDLYWSFIKEAKGLRGHDLHAYGTGEAFQSRFVGKDLIKVYEAGEYKAQFKKADLAELFPLVSSFKWPDNADSADCPKELAEEIKGLKGDFSASEEESEIPDPARDQDHHLQEPRRQGAGDRRHRPAPGSGETEPPRAELPRHP